MGKHVCIDCKFHHDSTIEELQAVPAGRYCKHFTPEYWMAQGYVRDWGDAAVNDFPTLEILRKEDETSTKYLIIQPLLRRTVEIYVDKKSGDSWGRYQVGPFDARGSCAAGHNPFSCLVPPIGS